MLSDVKRYKEKTQEGNLIFIQQPLLMASHAFGRRKDAEKDECSDTRASAGPSDDSAF